MKRRKKHLKTSVKVFLFLLLTLCIVVGGSLYIKHSNNEVNIDKTTPDTFLNKVVNDSGYNIKEGWEDLIVKYLDIYYKSMYTLKTEDVRTLFTDPDGSEAYLTYKAIDLLVEHHKMQVNDMSLTDAKYDIIYKDISISGNIVTIDFLENDYLKFNYLNGIESKAYDVLNTIVLRKSDDVYTIESLRIVQGYYVMFTNEVDMNLESAKTIIDNLSNKYINTMKEEVESNKQLQQDAISYKTTLTYNHPYNREDAVSYAIEYVDKRNSEYTAYDSSGGNCQNFASQSIHNGGIPMDYSGSYQWKHYSSSLNNSNIASGRSASWISTNSFYEYAKNNTGRGLVSDTDVNIFYGEKGDIAQVGYNGYSHTVIVIDQVLNSDNEVIDLLINCNTVSLEDYPLLGYVYPNKRLIKILGYND